MRSIPLLLCFVCLLLIPARVFAAQAATTDELLQALANVTTIAWIVGSLIFGYILGVAFTAGFGALGYPPKIARFGSWLGITLALLFIAFVVFGIIIPLHLPVWIIISVCVVIGLFGIVLLATSRRG